VQQDDRVLPKWNGECLTDVVPGLLGPQPSLLFGDEIRDAKATVLLVIDGLGWHQLRERPHIAPTLTGLTGQPITTVAPSTTGAALTSLATGAAPGEHGVVGYRIAVDNEILNVLSWRTENGDARRRVVPEDFQRIPPFLGADPLVVQNKGFRTSGFTRAHLAGCRQQGWTTFPTLPVEVVAAVRSGERFVYAYYDGIDKIAHEYGFGDHYDAELAAVDQLVAGLLATLPDQTALVVTADHGLVECRDGEVALTKSVEPAVRGQSGEARFRWLHTHTGASVDVVAEIGQHHGEQVWVSSLEQVLDERWLGSHVSETARRRLGDVAVVAKGGWTVADPGEQNSFPLLGRHGSLTPDEMLVPLLSVRL
jgi:hypothetical protein